MSSTLIVAFTCLQVFHGFADALEGNCRLFRTNKVVKFDLHEAICCDGTVYIKDVDDNGNMRTKCCYGRNSAMYDVETQECCGGKVIRKDSFLEGCCRGKAFNKERYTCCEGQIKIKMATPCCGDEPVNPYDGVQCCGGSMYDNRTQTCCDGFVWDGTGECCGDKLVNFQFNDICCTHHGATRIHIEAQGTLCCGLDTYRPNDQLCCQSIVKNKIGDITECCGNTTFNITGEVCCQGQVLSREFGKTSCCGGQLYNKNDEICCEDNIYPRGGRSKCCGDKVYQGEKSLCINKSIVSESAPSIAGIVHFTNDGSTAYLKTNQFECGGELMIRTKKRNACCDSAPYNTADHLCCGVSNSSFELVKKSRTHNKCCGRSSYDSEKQGCCKSQTSAVVYDLENEICNEHGVHPKYGVIEIAEPFLRKKFKDKLCTVEGASSVPYNSNTSVCTPIGVVALPEGLDICGNKTFNKDHFICCRGSIFDKYVGVGGEIQECCPNPVEKETYIPASQTCFNGRIVDISEKYTGNCGGKAFDNRTHGCDIVGEIRSIEEIEDKPYVCFNDTHFFYFNNETEKCCNGHVIEAVYTCCAEENECCDTGAITGYNRETHACCGGVLRETQAIQFKRSVAAYSQSTSRVSQRTSFLCCQETLRENIQGDLTCDRNLLTGRFSNNSLICRGKLCKNGTDCCGDRSYDNETELCCGGEILRKSDNKSCCGNHILDPLNEDTLCCESSFYENATGQECCGGVKFNPTNETCCTTGDKTYVFPSTDGLCCSNGEDFDDTLHTCCDGLVHKYITNGTCCGNDVIRDPTRESCYNNRVYQL